MVSQETYALRWETPMKRELSEIADEDIRLVRRFLNGDSTAFDTLFLKYQDYVYRIVFGIVGNPDEARDITQDVFLQVHSSLSGFRQNSRFSTWLYRIASNRAIDSARSSRRRRFFNFDDLPGTRLAAADREKEPPQIAERNYSNSLVHEILLACPLPHRQALVLRYFSDLTLEEIAEVMKCSITAAKVRLHRARSVFKLKYTAAYGNAAAEMLLPEEETNAAHTP